LTKRRGGCVKRVAAFAPALVIGLTLNGTQMVMAQGTPPPSPATAGAAPATGTVSATGAAPAAGTNPAVRTLTLQDVVNLAVNDNSSVVLARERLQKAGFQINATNAEARPQVTGTLLDTYDSLKTFGTSGSASVSNPTLPGGGTIPTITDQGGGTTTTFVGGGGGGTTGSSGATSTIGTTSASSTTGNTNISTGVSGGGTVGAGGGTGTGSSSTGSTGAASGSAMQMQALPSIARQYAAAMVEPVPGDTGHAVAHSSGTTGGSGGTTGTTGTTGTATSGNSGYHNNESARVTVTQYIDIFGFVPAALDVEKITREFYQIDLQRVENETALAAKDDFFTVLRDQAQIGVDQEQVNAAAANLRIAEVQYEAGTTAEANVLTAEVTLSNDQQTEISDQSTLNLAVANLDNLLGLPADEQVALQPPALPPFTAAIDLQRSTQIALDQRPELVEAQNNITIAHKLIRLAGASLYPTLGVSGTASYAGNNSPGSPHDDYTVTAQVSIPLYDGGYTRSEVESAKVDLQTQLTTQAQLQQNVTLEVRQSYLDIINDQAKGASAAVGTANAREAARIASLQYQYGTNTFLNVLNAQAQLATAETDELNAEYSYQSDLATLVRAIGGR
jgi:outer membrane protein